MEQNSILVMSTSLDAEDGTAYGIPPDPILLHRTYRYFEFHLVDLKTKEIHVNYAPSLLQYATPNTLVAADEFVYIFGGPYPTEPLPSQSFDSHQQVFMGASRLRLDLDPSQGDGWCPAPALTCPSPLCISLDSKIYNFRSLVSTPEVFDPMNDPHEWKPIPDYPSDLEACQVSLCPIPDPSKTRFLLHVTGGKLPSPSIYSFSPTLGWNLIIRDFQGWTPVAAVVDDVIFFHSHEFSTVLRGFDIQTGRWLKVHWASKFDVTGYNVNMNNKKHNRRMEFDALLPMGERMLCLAVWSLAYDLGPSRSTIRVTFLKFSVERIRSTIILRPDSSCSCALPPTAQVRNFLPV